METCDNSSPQNDYIMRIARSILSVAVLFGTLTNAWEEDSRCGRRRAFDPNETDKNLVIEKSERVVSPEKGLLGGSEDKRQLQQLSFMLKMYWEEGYCWQEEWRERKWCLKCEGSKCNEDDYLLLDKCSWNDDEQWFVYESIDAAEYKIKLKPWTNPDLCWTRSGDNAHTLKPCGDDYLDSSGRDAQVLIGFKENGEFELHPNGRSGDCLVNSHHPRWDEIIWPQDCETARNDRTSKWEVYNAEEEDAYEEDNDDDAVDLPVIQDNGVDYCSPDNPCGECSGDCNYDDDCQDDLVCYKREAYESVPFCSGGSSDGSRRDYCTYPS